MNEEIDDIDFFQQDFTTASAFELFNARLEQIFQHWTLKEEFTKTLKPALKKNELFLHQWESVFENISFADFELVVTRHKLQQDPQLNVEEENEECCSKNTAEQTQCFADLMCSANDFYHTDSDLHPIARWYGIREFIVMKPVHAVKNESQIQLLLSSIHMATNESHCEIPVFVHVMEHTRNIFLGVSQTPSIRTSFDIVHLHHTPNTLKSIPGLLDMFKGKVAMQYQDPVTISLRMKNSYAKSHKKTTLEDFQWQSEILDFTDSHHRFGVSIDPIVEIKLFSVWPEVAENVVCSDVIGHDNEINLEFLRSMEIKFEVSPLCYLTDVLNEYIQCSESKRSLVECVGSQALALPMMEGENPLDLLTESKIPKLTLGLSEIKLLKKGVHSFDGPLKDAQLQEMLYYMFPDADTVKPSFYKIPDAEPFDPLKIKSAFEDSLIHRLSTLLSICNCFYEGKIAIAHLFAEFTAELRYRVERCIQIPGVAPGFPDSRTCLLHQKLQMLNICMDRRRVREGGLPFSMTSTATSTSDETGKDSDTEEFFDLSDNDEDTSKFKHELWNEPIGRLSRLGKMLLVDTDEPVYIPITQEPVPKTEDELEDDAEVMLKLGPGSELRTQMMSASLLSDMESFKAANPSGKFEDFIRWYSPRDWMEDDTDEKDPFGRKGHLSERMLIEGNTWQSVWKTARPVPAHRQKRLFDDTKEAEKVLNFFETITVGKICQLTIPVLFHNALFKIKKETVKYQKCIPNFEESYNRAISNCCKLSRENWTTNSSMPRGTATKKWENLLNEIQNFEYYFGKAEHLSSKIFAHDETLNVEKEQFICALLTGQEVELPESLKNEIYDSRFQFIEESDQCTVEKQVILRVSGKTVLKGDQGPQFLRAILKPNEMRLCGAFSRNTTFM